MANALASPVDILVAYDPGLVAMSDQAAPLEVETPVIKGGADTNYEDFTSALRGYVEARRSVPGGDSRDGTLVGGWLGGGGNPAVIIGLDWLARDGAEDARAEDARGEDDRHEDGRAEDGHGEDGRDEDDRGNVDGAAEEADSGVFDITAVLEERKDAGDVGQYVEPAGFDIASFVEDKA